MGRHIIESPPRRPTHPRVTACSATSCTHRRLRTFRIHRRAPSTSPRKPARSFTFFYAQPDFPTPIYGEARCSTRQPWSSSSRAAAAEAEKILGLAKAAADAAGVSSIGDTVISEVPFEAIIASAERNRCDLIFMASHGRRGLSGLLLGSETQKVSPTVRSRCSCIADTLRATHCSPIRPVGAPRRHRALYLVGDAVRLLQNKGQQC